MSHSQFHSTNLFILRHAWLNLWDKHMTTGRINQVTTFPEGTEYSVARATFLGQEFVLWFNKTSAGEPEDCLVPRISHHSDPSAFCCFATKRNSLQRELPAISKTVSLDHGGFSSALIAEQVWPSASSPHFLPCASAETPVLDFCTSRLKKVYPKSVFSSEEKHHWFGTRQASQPFSLSLQQRHTQLDFNLFKSY